VTVCELLNWSTVDKSIQNPDTPQITVGGTETCLGNYNTSLALIYTRVYKNQID